MPRTFRLVVISVVLTSLTLMIGLASAQEAPTSPQVGVCLPGAGYASGCDVDQDGDIDINDVQLTTGRWNSSGVYTPGHTHWGETWTGASGSWGLRLDHTATSGTVYGLVGTSLSPDGRGIRGYAGADSGAAYGVEGQSASQAGAGVYGWVTAASGATTGVVGRSESTSGTGVYGYVTAGSGSTIGVRGNSPSTSGTGVSGLASADSGATTGVSGESASPDGGTGVFGVATAGSGDTFGVRGQSNSPYGVGVSGLATATSGVTVGVFGEIASPDGGRGVIGVASAASGGTIGVEGQSNSSDGTGVYGQATASSGATVGVFGQSRSSSSNGVGVYGQASHPFGAATGVYGVSVGPNGMGGHFKGHDALFAESYSHNGTAGHFDGMGADALLVQNIASGRAIQAYAPGDTAVWAKTNSGFAGVDAWNSSTSGRGVSGWASAATGNTHGVWGQSASSSGTGVLGWASAPSGDTTGVYGESVSPDGQGVFGVASASSGTNYGVYGWSNSPGGYAGYFDGQVQVTGILSKGGGAFKIDHPLDPANQYLYHSFVESPDMKNIYDGVAILDDDGAAVVTLPDWFGALNRDFRYQLTPIGGWAPLYIAQKIKDNRFQIAGGEAGMEVSWQVTGIRQDAYANAHRIPVEEAKPAGERGLYLHPVELGQPAGLGLHYQRNLDQQVDHQEE
jgi:hypothetical protein